MRLLEYRYPAVEIALFVILAIWVLRTSGVLEIPSGLTYDLMVRHNLAPHTVSKQILLVRADYEERNASNGYWLRLLDTLELMQAKQILFTFIPGNATSAFFESAQRYGNVILGRAVIEDQENPGRRILEPIPEELAQSSIPLGIVDQPPSSYGIHREQYANIQIAGQHYPTLEIVAVNTALATPLLPTENYLINFLADENTTPVVTSKRVMSGGLIPDLVQDKHVVIGFSNSAFLPGIHTPITGGKARIPLLTFQGYALETLLTQQMLYKLASKYCLVILLAIVLLSIFIYQSTSLKLATWISFSLATIYLLISWLMLSYSLLVLPIVEMLLAQLAMFFLIFRFKSILEEQELTQMLLENSAKQQNRIAQPSFYNSPEHWSQIINLINQTFDLDRVIFLERIEGDHRVREIKALNCSLDAISERRRDYERAPYSTAIAENGPIQLNSEYFTQVSSDEQQYMVPLIFAGEILGFWAFTITPEKLATMPLFSARIKDYGVQIGELLYHRKQWMKQKKSQTKLFSQYINLETDSTTYKTLHRSQEITNRRFTLLENVFNGQSTATILYNLFGGLVQMNQTMSTILQHANLPAYEMTALDLITAVTEMDLAQARHTMRYVVLEQGNINVPTSVNGVNNETLLLNIRPLAQNEADDSTSPNPFSLLGILFEFINISELKKLYILKDRLIERLNIQLRNDMESMIVAADILQSDNVSGQKRRRVLSIIQDKVTQAVDVLQEAQQHLDINVQELLLERYPLEAKPPLLTAITAVTEKASRRHVEVQPDTSALVGLVFAEPNTLISVLKSILDVLIEDASENSTIKIRLQQTDQTNTFQHSVIFLFENTGFGIPEERLNNYLYGEMSSSTELFQQLRNSVHIVQDWGGNLEAHSDVGVGMRFNLKLKGFL
ncbi:MAG: CHASE2 domain-containing protein [Gammaproteobacteria bacterium]|nr:CHASE2 domain-containing protein [Gammaproteobacteria bacterium]